MFKLSSGQMLIPANLDFRSHSDGFLLENFFDDLSVAFTEERNDQSTKHPVISNLTLFLGLLRRLFVGRPLVSRLLALRPPVSIRRKIHGEKVSSYL